MLNRIKSTTIQVNLDYGYNCDNLQRYIMGQCFDKVKESFL